MLIQVFKYGINRFIVIHYSYFNPSTERPTSFEEAHVALSDIKSDKFSGLRADGTKFVIGIEMNLTFIYETRPSLDMNDSADRDELRHPIYRYELESDEAGHIIGGEWRTRIHPDVLWLAQANSHSMTVGDRELQHDSTIWNRDEILPAAWIDGAKISEKYSQPLAKIVEHLFVWANQ